MASGQSALPPAQLARLRHRVAATDGGNMMVAVGFATAAAADRWGTRLPDLRRLSEPGTTGSRVSDGAPGRPAAS